MMLSMKLYLLLSLAFLSQCSAFIKANQRGSRAHISAIEMKTNVLVVGATGRLGRLVVENLALQQSPILRNVSSSDAIQIKALVRDEKKARSIFSDPKIVKNVDFITADLTKVSSEQLTQQLADNSIDHVLWCAAGFTDSPNTSNFGKVFSAFKLKFFPQQSIDITALETIGAYFSSKKDKKRARAEEVVPVSDVVMCSSAGVTRPLWDDEKKHKYIGAADIPIVRLNPLNILGVKRQSENALRKSKCNYVIVRPTGLNDKHPINSRPVLSQGDVAVGRINRRDVASFMIDMLFAPMAFQKTFEVVAIPNLPVPRAYTDQLSRLDVDEIEELLALEEESSLGDVEIKGTAINEPIPVSEKDLIKEAELEATYKILQQIVPGEILRPNELAMGQTYEQLDKKETGRLGKRGVEEAPIMEDK